MGGRLRRRPVGITAVLAGLAGVAVAATVVLARGEPEQSDLPPAVICDYSAASQTVTIKLLSQGPQRSTEVVLSRSGDEITVSQGPFRQRVDCTGGPPTVMTTDTIEVTGAPGLFFAELDIRLDNGPFAPGATPEEGNGSEIEFRLDAPRGAWVEVGGASGRDRIEAGRVGGETGIDLNPGTGQPDADLLIGPRVGLFLEGRSGGDELIGRGRAFDGPLARSASLQGGPGDDLLVGGSEFDYVAGGSGADHLDAGAGDDSVLTPADGDRDRADCGRGRDSYGRPDGTDRLHSCERLDKRGPPDYGVPVPQRSR